jgi:cyanophycin synthetase
MAQLAGHFLARTEPPADGLWTGVSESRREYRVAIHHPNRALTDLALRYAFAATCSHYPPAAQVAFPQPYRNLSFTDVEQEFLSRVPAVRKSLQVKLLMMACRQLGIPWLHLDRYPDSTHLLQIGYGRFQRLFSTTLTDRSPHLSVKVIGSKHHTVRFLGDLGFPIPKQQLVTWAHEAREAASRIGYPVVVKPDRGGKGKGVHARLMSASEVHHAVKAIHRLHGGEQVPVVVEEWLPGNDYRLLVAGKRLISAVQRKHAQVCGDGVHSIAELVRIANSDPQRGDGISTQLVGLDLGDVEIAYLRTQGVSPTTVLPEGQVAFLRGTANLATGGTLERVTDQVHPDNRALAIRVAETLNVEILGLDIITADIGTSFLEGALKIIEVNVGPGVQTNPRADGTGQEAAAVAILDHLFPPENRRLVPIITVTGTSLTDPTVDSIHRGLAAAGHVVGASTRSSMLVGGAPWGAASTVDARDPNFQLLRNPFIDALVVERSYESLETWGLGSGGCDVAVVLDLEGRRSGESQVEDEVSSAQLARLLTQSSRIATVVSVDDPKMQRLCRSLPSERLCVWSREGWSEEISHHVNRGARAVVANRKPDGSTTLILAHDAQRQEITPPLWQAAGLERFPAAVLCACAVLFCLGHPAECLFGASESSETAHVACPPAEGR